MKLGLGIALLSLSAVSSAQFFFDDFNRANGPLGANYTNVSGTATQVISNQAGNTVGSNNLSLVTLGNYSASYMQTVVEADITHSGVVGTGYGALAFGHNGGTTVGNGLFIKVQTQGTVAAFNFIGFYTGVGVGTTSAWTDPPVFFATTANFTRAHMTVWASDATTINLGIDTDFNGIDDQVYTRHMNLGAMSFGNQVGLGVFGTNTTLDNFQASAVPEPASMAALGLGALALLRRRRNNK